MRQIAHTRVQKGFTLIELMISMVLGLLVIGGILAVFLSTTQTVRVTDAMARNQENARVVFELLARDLRELAPSICQGDLIDSSINEWWHSNDAILAGYSNNFPATVAGFPLANQVNNQAVDAIKFYTAAPVLTGDAVVALNTSCYISRALGVPDNAFVNGASPQQTYNPVGWYIGCSNGQSPCNNSNDRALFYVYVNNGTSEAIPIVNNILSMKLRFLESDDLTAYKSIAQNPDWNDVVAVEIQLVFDESAYSNNNRTITHVVQLRSREV